MMVKVVKYSLQDVQYKDYYFLNKIRYLRKENAYSYRKTYLFNICISNKKNDNLILKNSLNLKKLFAQKIPCVFNEKIDIIIPVYNGYDYLTNLFESIKLNTDLDYKLIVINDNSSDERILPLLEKYKSEFDSKMQLIKNDKNLGFVKSVNKGLQLSTQNVVILNTDVVLPKNWASRLISPIINNNKIASVTPFSNAATIFSLPQNGFDNEFNSDLEKVNHYISKLNSASLNINFPTGVGYCMAMNKIAIKKIGFLDEIFEKGYGEENDWCQRAIKYGFINTIAPDLFVWHKHGGSFVSSEKQKLINSHLKIIKSKYPDYFQHVNSLVVSEKYLSLRFFAELLYLKSVTDNTQFWFDHTSGGGTEHYTFNKIDELKNNTLFIRLQNNGTDIYNLSFFFKQYKNSILIDSLEDIDIIFEQILPDLIVVNNLATYNNVLKTLDFIENLKRKHNTKISFRAHDLQAVCPTVTMVNSQNKYCNCSDFNGCKKCFDSLNEMTIKTNDIEIWHKKWSHFINNVVDEIIFFSNSTKNIFQKFFQNIQNKSLVIPHFVPELRKVSVKKHNCINIGVLGSINENKGLCILKDISKLLSDYKNINITVIGKCKENINNIKITGRYEINDLPDIIEKEKIDIILIPSVWPETFSYTTSEALNMGLPVACFNIGAPAERIINGVNGLIISNIDANCTLKEISEYFGVRSKKLTCSH